MIRVVFGFILLSSLVFADWFNFQTINRAKKAYEEGDFKRSARLFSTLEIDDSTVRYNQANALYKAGEYDQALKIYKGLKGVNEADRLYNMGNCYFQKNAFESAIKSYEMALKIKDDTDTRYNLELAKKKKCEQNQKKQQKKKEPKKEPKKPNEKKSKSGQKKKPKAEKSKTQPKKKMPKKNQDEEMRKRELKHMMKELAKQKMPTLMYQTDDKKGGEDEANPW